MAYLTSIVFLPLLVFFVFWLMTWRSSKKTVEKQSASGWFSYWIFSVVGIIFLFGLITFPFLNISLIQGSLISRCLGFLVELSGLFIAIWARTTLGRNWSATVSFKEKHELITKGPYRLVRHPIYTGMLTMFLGVAIYIGVLSGFLGIFFFFLSFWIKSRQEERLMLKHFAKEYKNYEKTTKALIPFIY